MLRTWRAGRIACVALFALAAAACGTRGAVEPDDVPNDPGGDNGPVDETGIVGTWDIISVDGGAVTIGSLRWIFTETTYTAIISDCTETGSYTYAADTLRAATGALTGAGCAGAVGATAVYQVTIAEGALTALIPNVETGETMVFVFVRI